MAHRVLDGYKHDVLDLLYKCWNSKNPSNELNGFEVYYHRC